MNRRYSDQRKERALRRMLDEKVGVTELSRQTGISKTTLWKWKKEALNSHAPSASQSAPETRAADEKMRLVLASQPLAGNELGSFLRSEGVHLSDLRRWKEQMRDGLDGRGAADTAAKKELRRAHQDRRELEHELRRKEAALAEAAALLVLSKKARRLWGDEAAATTGTTDKWSST